MIDLRDTPKTHSLKNLVATAIGLIIIGATSPVVAQVKDRSTLLIGSFTQCKVLAGRLRGQESGAQWLIRKSVKFQGRPNDPTPIATEMDMFDRVNCYDEVTDGGLDLVFVATRDFEKCGWVDRTLLRDEHGIDASFGLSSGGLDGKICEMPQPKPFKAFCDDIAASSGSHAAEFCAGVPLGLRSKGVLIGSTVESEESKYPFLSSPNGTKPRSSKLFFSTLTVHRTETNDRGRDMVLVGDGAGDMFGWIDLGAIQLWPTRLGLFYDHAATGRMFETTKDLKVNWRDESVAPTITYDQGITRLEDHLHGKLPLLTYPIVRTHTPELDTTMTDRDVSFHEVVFLGQTGAGSASQLMGQGKRAQQVQEFRDINVQFVIDTTESMTEYLPYIRTGLYDFIVKYQHDPELRAVLCRAIACPLSLTATLPIVRPLR